ncbi:FAD-dependent oxidoreductase [Microlunatus sp. Gsoil 973]|uniref:FAD-dependent oxidoreductase n=1 Tax=Microlunatus sp. Gsoil 973 TaxID=2672569 RepID=UPI001E5CB8B7|nr:FAD-dependent oxidoreductase [Microlunatus sp. Gsoil 973]
MVFGFEGNGLIAAIGISTWMSWVGQSVDRRMVVASAPVVALPKPCPERWGHDGRVTQRTTCLIAGGGPAGIMLGLLLARAGIEVTVAEKHGDFLRDFRGDTVHASTLQLLGELGLEDRFRAMPHVDLADYRLPLPNGRTIVLGDFSSLPGPYHHIALAPQWDLLSLLAETAAEEPSFRLLMNTEVLGPVVDHGRVVGARVRSADGESVIKADLTVACDGRNSDLRSGAGMVPHEYRVPYDVWWFRLSRTDAERESELPTLLPTIKPPDIMLAMSHHAYYQIAYLAPKGSQARLREEGIASFRARIARLRPDLADRVDELTSMDELPILDVRMNRLHRWHRPGLLCIGDAAHAMSPSGGVGVNLAIQDAVAAARCLAEPLRQRWVTDHDLDQVRRRRLFPTVFLQTGQRLLHATIYEPAMAGLPGGFEAATLVLRLLPWLSRPVGRLIAIGPRPETAPAFARR